MYLVLTPPAAKNPRAFLPPSRLVDLRGPSNAAPPSAAAAVAVVAAAVTPPVPRSPPVATLLPLSTPSLQEQVNLIKQSLAQGTAVGLGEACVRVAGFASSCSKQGPPKAAVPKD